MRKALRDEDVIDNFTGREYERHKNCVTLVVKLSATLRKVKEVKMKIEVLTDLQAMGVGLVYPKGSRVECIKLNKRYAYLPCFNGCTYMTSAKNVKVIEEE